MWFVTFYNLGKSIWSSWIGPHLAKILQNFWLSLVKFMPHYWLIAISLRFVDDFREISHNSFIFFFFFFFFSFIVHFCGQFWRISQLHFSFRHVWQCFSLITTEQPTMSWLEVLLYNLWKKQVNSDIWFQFAPHYQTKPMQIDVIIWLTFQKKKKKKLFCNLLTCPLTRTNGR